MKPHIQPTDITIDEVRKALGEHPTRFQVEDYLFYNLNDDFSGMGPEYRKNTIDWYFDKLNK